MEKESSTIMSAVLAKGLHLLTGGDTVEGDNLGGILFHIFISLINNIYLHSRQTLKI